MQIHGHSNIEYKNDILVKYATLCNLAFLNFSITKKWFSSQALCTLSFTPLLSGLDVHKYLYMQKNKKGDYNCKEVVTSIFYFHYSRDIEIPH